MRVDEGDIMRRSYRIQSMLAEQNLQVQEVNRRDPFSQKPAQAEGRHAAPLRSARAQFSPAHKSILERCLHSEAESRLTRHSQQQARV